MLFGQGLAAAADRLRACTGATVRVVAVDGHSAAGKSTFAAALAERAGASLLSGDDFYRVMGEDERARLSAREGVERYYDWERMREAALLPLLARQAATYRPYDWDSGLLAARPVTVPPARIVVVEGLFVSRPELEGFVHLSVLVEAPVAVRWRRQLERGDSVEWLERWDAAERLFFEMIRPRREFDLVVDGEDLR